MADGAGTVCIHRVTRGASKDRTAPRKWVADRRQRAEGNPPPTAKPRRGGNRISVFGPPGAIFAGACSAHPGDGAPHERQL